MGLKHNMWVSEGMNGWGEKGLVDEGTGCMASDPCRQATLGLYTRTQCRETWDETRGEDTHVHMWRTRADSLWNLTCQSRDLQSTQLWKGLLGYLIFGKMYFSD